MIQKTLSPFYWLWIPVVAMGIQIILEVSLSGNVLSHLHSENGLHETLQAIVAVLAFLMALKGFFSKFTKTILLKIWFALAAICCFYVAGEEVSWGQHVWDWATPEFWSAVNDQEETNLHNTSSWLDQKPRLILLIGIVFGSLVYPFLKYKNIFKLPENLDFLMPTSELRIIAWLVFIPQMLEKAFEAFDIHIFARFSEVQELYMFYFVLLYLVLLYRKVTILQKS